MRATLFAIPGSHPVMAARLMLEHKGVPYRRIDLLSPLHRAVVRTAGFPGTTVPALKVDGQRVQGTRAIARWLDEVRPEPPLVPADPELRRRVEEAEAWADDELQAPIRRFTFAALQRDSSGVESFMRDARLGPPALLARTAGPLIWAAARANAVSAERTRADLASFPALFDRADGYVEDGTIGGEVLNVADFQVASSIRLLMCFDDFQPALEGRPAGAHALRVCPHYAGRIGPVLGADERKAALGL